MKLPIIITIATFLIAPVNHPAPQEISTTYTSVKTHTAIKHVALSPQTPLTPITPIIQSYADVIGQNTYRDYIFSVESGDSLTSVNYLGCYGLGQDCNNWLATGRLDSPVCPDWQTNLDCQLRYWDWYANTVYRGWANSYAFRSAHNYW